MSAPGFSTYGARTIEITWPVGRMAGQTDGSASPAYGSGGHVAPPLQKPLDTKTLIVCGFIFRLPSEIRARDIYTTTGRAGGRGAGDRFSYGFSRLGRPLRPPHRGAVAGGAVPNKKNHRKIDLLRPPSGPRRPVVVYISRAPGPVGAALFPGQGAERHLRGGSTMPETMPNTKGKLIKNHQTHRNLGTLPGKGFCISALTASTDFHVHVAGRTSLQGSGTR